MSRVAQEYLCDMYSRYEEQSLQFLSSPAGQKRATTYKVFAEANIDSKVGKVLPKGHHGHPAKLKANTIDALAVVARKGRPSAMITMTCDGKCEAIQANLLPGQTAFDKPDLCDGCSRFKKTSL